MDGTRRIEDEISHPLHHSDRRLHLVSETARIFATLLKTSARLCKRKVQEHGKDRFLDEPLTQRLNCLRVTDAVNDDQVLMPGRRCPAQLLDETRTPAAARARLGWWRRARSAGSTGAVRASS